MTDDSAPQDKEGLYYVTQTDDGGWNYEYIGDVFEDLEALADEWENMDGVDNQHACAMKLRTLIAEYRSGADD